MQFVLRIYHHFLADSLYRNSLFLIMSTFVMAFLGFFFWILNARLFTPTQVGLATTLLSVTTLIATFSLLGLGNSLIKYLPSSKQKTEKINTVFNVVAFTSILASGIFILFVDQAAPALLFVKQNPLLAMLFIFFTIASSLNLITDSIFIAFRSTKYILIKNTILSIVKLVLPIILVNSGATGMYLSVGIATTLAVGAALYFLIKNYTFSPKRIIDRGILQKMTRFSLGNYISGFLTLLPVLVLPIIITNSLGAQFSAYFFIDMMIANLLFVIPQSIAQSLFAEGSYNDKELRIQIKKASVAIVALVLPAIALILLLGKYVLLSFGPAYASEGSMLLRMLAISGVFVSINSLGNAIFYIQHKMKTVIYVNMLSTSLIVSLSLFMAKSLTDMGIYWLLGQAMISVFYIVFLRHSLTQTIRSISSIRYPLVLN